MTFADWAETGDIVVRLVVSLMTGGAVGLNRVMHGKPAGLRLHATVALATATITLAMVIRYDAAAVSRVIQGIVAGIGFLSAGVIMRGAAPSGPGVIYHLTTAASIWLAAVLGIVCGLGLYMLAMISTALALLALAVFIRIDRALYARFGQEDDKGDPVA